jgi:uridine kinase
MPGVLGRYDMVAIGELLNLLQARQGGGLNVSLPAYHKLTHQRVEGVETARIMSSDIVILEGTVALALETGTSMEAHRIHVDIDEGTRRQRILNEYRLRGLGESEALDVYVRRTEDELATVESLASASRRISLAEVSNSTVRFTV